MLRLEVFLIIFVLIASMLVVVLLAWSVALIEWIQIKVACLVTTSGESVLLLLMHRLSLIGLSLIDCEMMMMVIMMQLMTMIEEYIVALRCQ